MKRRTLINLALFPFVVLAILVVALLTLDLNPYRDQVTWSLEQAFARPVTLGTIDLTLERGLALEVHDLEVGRETDPNYFRTDRGVLSLRMLPLLTGQLTFNGILLEKPRLHITLAEATPAADAAEEGARPLFAGIPALRELHLIEAELELHNLAPELPLLRLSHLELDLRGLHPGETGQVTLRGLLGTAGAPTPLSLEASFDIPEGEETWLEQKLDLTMEARRVSRNAWREILPRAVTALLPETPFDLHLAVNHDASGRLTTDVTVENPDPDGTCRPPNLTFHLDPSALRGSYGDGAAQLDLALDGRGSLESCGEKLASFTLAQSVSRGDGTLSFDGRLDSRFASGATLDWLTDGTTALDAEGPLPVRMAVRGTGERADWSLEGDFTQVGLHLGALLVKTPGITGSVKASGGLGAGRRNLQAGSFELGPLRAGLAPSTTPEGVEVLELTLEPTDLAHLDEVVPALAQWNLHGSLGGGYRFRKSPEGWQREGSLELVDLAAEHPYPLGPVRNTRATLDFHDRSLTFACTPLGLGESRLEVRGEIADLSAPVLTLHAETPRMLARDLIFKRPGANLHDLSGTLRIDRQGMEFVRAHVRLDQGTVADVDGRLDFATSRLYLNARASYGHIDEVIRLFGGPPRFNAELSAERRQRSERPPLRVNVEAEVDKGEIRAVGFSKARGTITVEDGNVIVYPLRFSGREQGDATARVHYTPREGQSGWLRVTGHLDGFESRQIYTEYMQREGEVKGPIDADFFLQGPADDTFRARVDGGVYFEIKDGNFRRFNALSKAFSLLNISQIFSGELPDMSGRGMKFNLARGTLSFGGGYVYTDDLSVFSNSLNMSFIGRVELDKLEADYILGVQPLQTVDKVVSKIPLVGWVLTGDEKTLFTVHFQVKGPLGDPEVTAIPGSSLGSGILGIFQRTLRLPGKLIGK